MSEAGEIAASARHARAYLTGVLLPFWIERAPDPAGGFLTYFDRNGVATGETDKTLLMQVRMLWSMAAAHRAGYGEGRCAELARAGADFVLAHYWDDVAGGWYWIADRDGEPTVRAKIGYGQCFAMYAFAEYFLATGDERGREAMLRTHAVVRERMLDRRHGGYLEIMDRDWRPAPPGRHGGDRKSFDVHVHVMEALTSVLQVTGDAAHRAELVEVIELLLGQMLDPTRRAGLLQFGLDFTPLPAIRFDVEWGSDDEPPGGAFPLQATSYGHNVEFAWLLARAEALLGVERSPVGRALLDHCLEFGIDREHGGVFVGGPVDGPATDTHKQFWQQAEALVGLLDGWQAYRDARYWRAFRSLYDFVFAKFVHLPGGGEWFAMLERDGTPRWDYLGHAWKISYHTVRAMLEIVRRLAQ